MAQEMAEEGDMEWRIKNRVGLTVVCCIRKLDAFFEGFVFSFGDTMISKEAYA
jgi:hypothetical protein